MPTKAEFVKNVMRFTGITNKTAAAAIADQVIEAIVFSAGQGPLVLRSFGTFKTVLRKARIARNPLTNVAVAVPAREKLVFKCSDLLSKD
jgi:nucleoid DNA-binding protein